MSKIINDTIWWLNRNKALLTRNDGKFILRQEARVRAGLNRIFRQQMKYLLQEFKKTDLFTSTNALDDQLNNIVDGMPGQSKLVETILIYAASSMKKGGETTVKKLALKEFGIDFSLKHPSAVAYLDAKRSLELSNYRGNINSRTKSRIVEIVRDGVLNGKSYGEVAEAIAAQGEAGVFSAARSELIAVREMAQAYEQGRVAPIYDFTARFPNRQVVKSWLTAGDDQVTPECEENEEQGWIRFDESFPNDGDQQEAPRSGNPRCRCTTLYDIIAE